MRTITSPLLKGGKYKIVVPDAWDGTLILYSQGPPAPQEEPVWRSTPVVESFLARGYAVAGWASPMFWPLEQSFETQAIVLDDFAQAFREPERTIAYGQSIGGIITAGLVQRHGARLSGALAVCGPLAGGVATHNRELDIAFIFKTLIAPQSALEVSDITDPESNLRLALTLLESAASTHQGRARLALVAAVTNVPAAADPRESVPLPTDPQSRLNAQIRWFREIVFLVTFSARASVERRAGGNASWNEGVDYAQLLARSATRDIAEALYADAGLSLREDLDVLAAAPRIAADPERVRYLARFVAFNGDIEGVPVVTMHTTGDGLCTPDHERAYADVVHAEGNAAWLRQLWITRGGHCTFTLAETLTALDLLQARIDAHRWPTTEPAALNEAAAVLGLAQNALFDPHRPDEAVARPPQFGHFEPGPFPRPYDARMFGGS